MTGTLPALCAELKMHTDGVVALVNSRDVAEMFERSHAHVLRDISALEIDPDLARSFFRPVSFLDTYGRGQPSFDMNRDGFSILAMGFTGARAMKFKLRYIEAFNAMEEALKAPSVPVTTDQLMQGIREIVAPLAVRFDGQDHAIERVEARVDGLAEDMASVKKAILGRRRNLTEHTKCMHVEDTLALGGACPCCHVAAVIRDGEKSKFADFDHFYDCSKRGPDDTWLICRPCHTDLSSGRVPRDQREAEFRAYQSQRRRLPGRQPTLFG